jgi:hypothetical protein
MQMHVYVWRANWISSNEATLFETGLGVGLLFQAAIGMVYTV